MNAKYFVPGLLLALPLACLTLANLIIYILFGINCGGHLKLAANANTTELALKEINTVITYLEKNNITSGTTAVLYNTPSTDVTFWYQNLKAAQEELQKITPDTSQLERTNVLMKLRETILDTNENGSYASMPSGLYEYPNNIAWTSMLIVTGMLAIVGAFFLFCAFHYHYY